MEVIEIPFGAKDSELQEWTYTIPKGMKAEIRDGKVVIKKKESEDEKMIGVIRLALTDVPEERFTTEGTSLSKVLAWIEKQKYDRMKPIYGAGESFESALEKAWNDYHNGYENVDKLEDDYVECAHAKGFREGYLFGIEKQKEQKPIEWTELTWKDVNELEEIMNEVHSDYRGGGIGQKSFGLEVLERFRYIKGDELDVKEQKPTEWSEDDERMRNTIIQVLESFVSEATCESNPSLSCSYPTYRREIDWLKSLRPQPKDEIYKEKNEKPKHTEVWVEGRTIFEQDAKLPEVDLEKAIEEEKDHYFAIKDRGFNLDSIDVERIARRFYYLGKGGSK